MNVLLISNIVICHKLRAYIVTDHIGRVAQSEFRKILRFRKLNGPGGGVAAEKSSLGAREIPRVSKVQCGRGGGVIAEPSKKKSVDSSIDQLFVRRIPRFSKEQWGLGGGVVEEPSKTNS